MILATALAILSTQTFVIEGSSGPGKGKHVVLLAGDEEYRSEEMLPAFAALLAKRHGFKCTVIFSVNASGEIDPTVQDNQPGIEALRSADLCVMMLRFRRWPDQQMSHFVDYYLSGKPIIALRTSTHAFDYPADSTSRYAAYDWQSSEWPAGFGKQVLGETWVSHWGKHGSQATRGIPAAAHPILRGVENVFGPTDVYEASPPEDALVLMRGEVVAGMNENAPPATEVKKTSGGSVQPVNDPMMPIAWVRSHQNRSGQVNRVFTCTMGSAADFQSPGFRRLLVNAALWSLDLPIPPAANVELVGEYEPSPFGFNGYKKKVKPADLLRAYSGGA